MSVPTAEHSLEAPKVLLVDDNTANLQVLRENLDGLGYKLLIAKSGKSALEIVRKAHPDLVLLDIMMPEMDGYEVCRRLKSAEETRHIPVIFLTAMADAEDEAKGLALGAVDYITKPINPELVRARVQNHLELKRHRDHLEQLVRVKTREVQLTQAVMIESLATLAEYRDPETGGHIKRTQNYVKALAVKLKGHPRFRDLLDEQTIELLYLSAPLHDMGKVGVRDHILLKPGRLEDAEFVVDAFLTLTDIEMPELDGYGLAAEIRRLEQDGRPRTPILAITASDFDLDESKARSAGLDGYMLKPLDPKVLSKKLADIFCKRANAENP
jgi:putative two-component system response regulator